MIQPIHKIPIKLFIENKINLTRNKIIVLTTFIFSPVYILLIFFIDFSSNQKALEPAIKQLSQSISIGDEISADRVNKSILLLKHLNYSKISFKDGSCLYADENEINSNLNNQTVDSCSKNKNSFFSYSIKKLITNSQKEEIGQLQIEVSPPWENILLLPIVIAMSSLLILTFLKNSIYSNFSKIIENIEAFPLLLKQNKVSEFTISELDNTFSELVRLKSVEFSHIKNSTIHTVATQLSHDIRSPLAALEMISGSLGELPEDKRLIIRNSINRIRDIANSLLDKNREIKNDLSESNKTNEQITHKNEEFTNTLLSPLIDSIVTEKRIQYRNQIGVRIDFNQNRESYGLFAKVQPHEFQRILSNLIDNSVEAFINHTGSVEIYLYANSSNEIEILVKDNGKGIPENIIPKLGNRGETHGKENGSGLGLFHAKETIQKFNGSILIESIEKLGTSITLTLPREREASWFVPKIILTPKQTLIVFDDDQSIHQIWKGRVDSLSGASGVTFRNFSDPVELRKYYSKNFSELDEALFLMDYEISGTSESGLDVIETLGIQKQSILITSRYEEKNIRERCEYLGVKLIPKTMSGFVPMEIRDHV